MSDDSRLRGRPRPSPTSTPRLACRLRRRPASKPPTSRPRRFPIFTPFITLYSAYPAYPGPECSYRYTRTYDWAPPTGGRRRHGRYPWVCPPPPASESLYGLLTPTALAWAGAFTPLLRSDYGTSLDSCLASQLPPRPPQESDLPTPSETSPDPHNPQSGRGPGMARPSMKWVTLNDDDRHPCVSTPVSGTDDTGVTHSHWVSSLGRVSRKDRDPESKGGGRRGKCETVSLNKNGGSTPGRGSTPPTTRPPLSPDTSTIHQTPFLPRVSSSPPPRTLPPSPPSRPLLSSPRCPPPRTLPRDTPTGQM